MQEGDAGTLKKLYGIDAADLEGFALYTAPTNISADEILVVKLKDPGAAGAVQEKMGKVQVQRNIISFGTYITMFPQLVAGPHSQVR